MTRASGVAAFVTLGWACADPLPNWHPDRPVPEPTLFAPGIVSTPGAEEYGVTFMPDGNTVYFTRRERRQRQTILSSTFESGEWTDPVRPPFSTGRDENPSIQPDGARLVFSSRRQVGPRSLDESDNIWVVHRRRDGWSEPRPLAGNVNRPSPRDADWPVGYELAPAIGPDGDLYYWTEIASETGSDIHHAVREGDRYVDRGPVQGVTTDESESSMTFSSDGRYMVFQGVRDETGEGGQDLLISVRTETGWSPGEVIGPPVSTTANEGFPRFSPDGRFLLFSSDRNPERRWSVYFIDVGAVQALRRAGT